MRSGRVPALSGPFAAAVLLAALTIAGCESVLPRQYEYDEEIRLSLDGSATVYVNGSVPALVALRGIDLDVRPTARLDRAALRRFYASDNVRVSRISASRRQGRRFVHLRLAVNDVGRLGETRAFAWATYQLRLQGDQYIYKQAVGPPVGRDVGDVGWTGNELVAFRMHLPSRILYHDAPSKQVERGNILIWEQRLSDRLQGEPVRMEVRMEAESILYTTLWLFAAMGGAVIVLFAGILWWLMRRKA